MNRETDIAINHLTVIPTNHPENTNGDKQQFD